MTTDCDLFALTCGKPDVAILFGVSRWQVPAVHVHRSNAARQASTSSGELLFCDFLLVFFSQFGSGLIPSLF